MFRRSLMFLGLAVALAACSKAESKKTETPPEAAREKTAPEPTPQPDDVAAEPTSEGEGATIEPVVVQAKGTGEAKEATPTPSKDGDGKPEPEPAGETDASFALVVEQPAAVAPGAAATLRVRVTPGKGYKMNAEFPTKLTLEPTAGVELDKSSLVLADAEKFDDHQLVFAVKATPAAAGSYNVTGKIKFAVCTDATCDPKKRNVAFAVTAK